MGSLLVVTGPPGAGKSTVAAELAERISPSILVRGDDFFGFLASGSIEPWLPESNAQNQIVTEAAARATGRFVESYDTIYDGVIGPWLLDAFASFVGLAELDYAIILPTVEECVSRVAARIGHGFTDEQATRTMHAEFADATIDARHVLTETSPDAARTADAIRAAQASGRLRYNVSR